MEDTIDQSGSDEDMITYMLTTICNDGVLEIAKVCATEAIDQTDPPAGMLPQLVLAVTLPT